MCVCVMTFSELSLVINSMFSIIPSYCQSDNAPNDFTNGKCNDETIFFPATILKAVFGNSICIFNSQGYI